MVTGGAIYYAGPNEVKLSGGTIQGNKAENGYGGAVYQSAGTVNISTINNANSAINGSAVYVLFRLCNFSGCDINSNTASAGGAVGVGTDAATLTLLGTAKVRNNVWTNKGTTGNVFLTIDSDEVINATGLSNGAEVRIRFADDLVDTRGDIFGYFGSSTTYTNNTVISYPKNDNKISLARSGSGISCIGAKRIT